MAGNRHLLLPCVEAVGLDTDRHVEVEADLHAEPGRKFAARPQLLIGTPLDEFDELDLSCVRAGVKGCGVSVVRLLPVRWPFPPWPVEAVPQHFETGETRQYGATLGTKFRESRAASWLRPGLERLEGRPQRSPFQLGDGCVVDHIALAQTQQSVIIIGQHFG